MTRVHPALSTALLAATLLVAAAAATTGALGREPGRPLLQALLALQVGLLVQLGVVLVQVGGGARPAEPVPFTGYVVLSLLLLPGGLALSAAERSRWGSLVIAVACATVAVVELRLWATWG